MQIFEVTNVNLLLLRERYLDETLHTDSFSESEHCVKISKRLVKVFGSYGKKLNFDADLFLLLLLLLPLLHAL